MENENNEALTVNEQIGKAICEIAVACADTVRTKVNERKDKFKSAVANKATSSIDTFFDVADRVLA